MADMFQPSPDALTRELSGETVILDLATGRYFGLDPVGTRIWQLLCDKHEPAAIAEVLTREYEVDLARAQADTEKLVARLLEAKLIRPAVN